jgi:hypothetical protein
MPIVEVTASELLDADVEYVSLVKRGANRVPFRILKAEEQKGMAINLGQLFKTRNPESEIRAIAVSKNIDLEYAKGRIEKAGFTVADVEETEDAHIFKQSENTGTDVVIKVDDDIAVIAINVSKEMETFPSSIDFKENMGASGFFPGVKMATDVLVETMWNVMMTAESQEAAADSLGTVLTSFRKYIVSLAGSIPSGAFKLEVAGIELAEKSDEVTDEQDVAGEAQSEEEGMSEEETVEKSEVSEGDNTLEVESAGTYEEDVKKTVDDTASADSNQPDESEITTEVEKAEDEVPDGKATTDTDPLDFVDSFVAKLDERLGPITDLVTSLKDEVEKVKIQVAEVEKTADTITEAVKGTVIGEPNGDVRSGRNGSARTSLDDRIVKDDVSHMDTAFDVRFKKKRNRGLII